jgi:hypothetical protein
MSKEPPSIEVLRSFTEELVNLSLSILNSIKIKDQNDHMGFMAYHFVRSQIEHLKSINTLVDAGQYGDGIIIARTMIDGCAILYWAGQEPEVRPLDWRYYSWVEQFRRSYGKMMDSIDKKEMDSMLERYCQRFLKDDAKGKSQEDIVPDDYLKGWRKDKNKHKKLINITASDMFKKVGLTSQSGEADLYQCVYVNASERIHWDPLGLYELTLNDEGLKNKGGEALVTGFYSLYLSLAGLNAYFRLKFDHDLKELYDRLNARHLSSKMK